MFGFMVFALTAFCLSSDRQVSAFETCTSTEMANCTNVCGPHQQLSCNDGFCGCAHIVGVSGTCSAGNVAGCKGTCTYFPDEVMACNTDSECNCFHKTNVIVVPQNGTCLGMDITKCGPCPHSNDAIVCHSGMCHCHHVVPGTCDAIDVAACTGPCDATSAMICYLSKCYCDHVI